MSYELRSFLTSNGVATSRTTPYNPRGNGQVERYNGIIWKTIMLALKSSNKETEQWEEVLDPALHSIRSLLCTATNATPHERMFNHPRRSFNGNSTPTWLTEPGPVLMKKHVRTSKYDPLVEEVELIESNPEYAYVRFPDGRETTVSTRHLAPRGETLTSSEDEDEDKSLERKSNLDPQVEEPVGTGVPNQPQPSENLDGAQRPVRSRHPPKYLSEYVTNL